MTQPDKPLRAQAIPAGPARTEIRASNSRFIASAAPAATVEAARAFIAGVRAEMPDASHHVYAYIVGHGATTTLSMTDDGEPPGTAGRPVMAVLKGSGLGDVALVITRYFGGTLLGTGGLVRAYGDAAKAVLAILPRMEKIERRELSDHAAIRRLRAGPPADRRARRQHLRRNLRGRCCAAHIAAARRSGGVLQRRSRRRPPDRHRSIWLIASATLAFHHMLTDRMCHSYPACGML